MRRPERAFNGPARCREDSDTGGERVHTRIVKPKRGPTLLVRPLRRGDTATVSAMFERLGERSRRTRFNGPKPRLSTTDLEQLAAADPNHHVLVAYVQGDPRPAAIARLARHGSSAEIAFEVADELQHRGIGSALTAELIADARAAGITEVTALVASDNPAALALLAPDPEGARCPLRRARALDPRSAAVTGRYPPVVESFRYRLANPGRTVGEDGLAVRDQDALDGQRRQSAAARRGTAPAPGRRGTRGTGHPCR